MPIVPCFDPTTGASGGPASGGTPPVLCPFYDLPFETVDLTDGTWTLLDPDSLIDTVTFDGTHNIIVWNALGTGSGDYIWTDTNNRAPRWYKLLTINGTQVTSDDMLALGLLLETDDSYTDFNQRAVGGMAVDPTSTVSSTIQCVGTVLTRAGTANQNYGAFTINGQSTGSGATAAKGVGLVQVGGQFLGASSYHVLDSSNVRVASGSRPANATVPAGDDLYLCFGVGTRSSWDTVAAGDDQRIRLGYRAIKWSIP